MRILLIDNYDSFTFNLYQLIARVTGSLPTVVKNDQLTWDELEELHPDCCVISPGPGRPDNTRDFGICGQIIQQLDVPLLGVCLGHQGIGHSFGASVVRAPSPVHGRASRIYHDNKDILHGVPQWFEAIRYHSLVVARPLPEPLEELGWTEDGLIMALRHRTKPIWGVQFHPESICTQYGDKIISNFVELASGRTRCWRDTQTAVSPSASTTTSKPHNSELGQHSEWRVYSRKLSQCPDAESVFKSLYEDQPCAVWLDSSRVEPGLSRFSFLGAPVGEHGQVLRYNSNNRELWVLKNGQLLLFSMSIFEYLKTELGDMQVSSPELPFDFNCGFVGYWGYEMKAECGASAKYAAPTPDVSLAFLDRLLVIDHEQKCVYLLCLGRKGEEDLAAKWFVEVSDKLTALSPNDSPILRHRPGYVTFTLRQSREEYLRNILRSQESIRDGESYEICLTNQLHSVTDVEPFELYSALRQINPAPYSAFLKFDDVSVACSSPERFLRIDRYGQVESKPIKGTVGRGERAEEDVRKIELLRADPKNRSENLMIVDLLRNDLGRVCEVGTVEVSSLMHVETYATVHHLVSTIRGRLRSDRTALDCLQNAFPGGSMTGAPKIRTMELIDEMESEARGIYSGSIGFLALNGAADLNIVIRTAVFCSRGASIGVGGAIVALSDPEDEFEEILLKARPLLKAFQKVTGQKDEFEAWAKPCVLRATRSPQLRD